MFLLSHHNMLTVKLITLKIIIIIKNNASTIIIIVVVVAGMLRFIINFFIDRKCRGIYGAH